MQVMRRLLRHSFVYAVANGLQRITGFLLIPLYTRVLSVESYGTLEILTTLGNSGLVLATLGLPSALNKCYHRDCHDELDQKRLAGTMLWLLTPAALAAVAAAFFLAGPLARGLLGDVGASGLVTLSLISTATFALSQIPLTLLRARESSLIYSLLSFWQFLAMTGLNLWLVGRRGLGVRGVLLGSIGASVLVLVTSIPFLVRHTSLRFSPRLARSLLAFGLPMIPVAISGWVMDQSDRWLLAKMADRHEVGLYGLGYRFGMLVEVLLVVPFQMAWPAFYFRESARPDARDLYARVLTWYVLVGGWITLAVALAGEIALRLMADRSFWPGAAVIPLVAAAYFLNGLQYCVAPGVHLGGKTHVLPLISLAGAGSNVALNLLLIPRFGMMGAAAATLLSFLVLCGLTAWLSRQAYGFRFETARLWKATASLLGVGVVASMFQAESLVADVLVRGTILAVGSIVVGAWCFKELGIDWGVFVGTALSRLRPTRQER